jgi:hypothetical protein
VNDLIKRAREMCDPPQPCIYAKLAWRKVVMALVDELEAARKDARVQAKTTGHEWRQAGIAYERERCAKIAEGVEGPHQIGEGIPCSCGITIAECIREGEPK